MDADTSQGLAGAPGSMALLRRIRWAAATLIAGLVLSGLTAIPLETELKLTRQVLTATHAPDSLQAWIGRVHDGVRETNERFPFIAYGTDWLAFGHFMIALAMVGVWSDPVRNQWLWWFAVMACVLVIPAATGFGALRGIPWGWRCVDCSFGIVALIPAGLGLCWTRRLAGSAS
jgi:hypothetical protein